MTTYLLFILTIQQKELESDNTGTTKIVTGIVTTLTADGDIFATGVGTTATVQTEMHSLLVSQPSQQNNVIGLNVENNTGSGVDETTIRSKSTAANASNFVRSESSDGLYIGLLKYGTGHSAYDQEQLTMVVVFLCEYIFCSCNHYV